MWKTKTMSDWICSRMNADMDQEQGGTVAEDHAYPPRDGYADSWTQRNNAGSKSEKGGQEHVKQVTEGREEDKEK